MRANNTRVATALAPCATTTAAPDLYGEGVVGRHYEGKTASAGVVLRTRRYRSRTTPAGLCERTVVAGDGACARVARCSVSEAAAGAVGEQRTGQGRTPRRPAYRLVRRTALHTA